MAFVHLYIPALSHGAHAGSSHDFPAQPSFSHETRLKDQTRTIKDHLPARFGFRPGYAATMGICVGITTEFGKDSSKILLKNGGFMVVELGIRIIPAFCRWFFGEPMTVSNMDEIHNHLYVVCFYDMISSFKWDIPDV